MKVRYLLYLLPLMVNLFAKSDKESTGKLSEAEINTMIGNTLGADKLHKAAICGRISEMKRLLGFPPVPVNGLDEHQRTPLHWAVLAGQYEAAKLLLKHSAAIDLQDDERKTALHYAVIADDTKMAKMLIKKKAVINLPDKKGLCPFDYIKSEKMNDIFFKSE
ncbi:MAG: ankyrin repeat domain-containing protein [Epsilonproteobacteria bacterium]|nr:ankyrin repeat domain-containing protein [Campylobacterota bacterium]